MGLVVDKAHGDTEWIDVYRPPEMLVKNKDLYARVPIITGHHVLVNTENAKQLAVGMVGDTVLAEEAEDGETYLYTTGTIIAGDGIEAYEKYGELSVGYDPIIKWQDGEHNGKKYNAIMTGLAGVNHLLICKTARGGHQCMVMDSLDGRQKPFECIETEVKQMGLFKKIFAKPAEKPVHGDAKVVSALLQSINAGADAKTQVGLAKGIMGDTIDDTLKGYFDELMGDEVSKADKETLKKAVDVVDAYCSKLLGDAEDKPEEKKPEGDEQHGPDCDCDECTKAKSEGDEKPKEEPKANGDSIDYEKLASMVAEKLKPTEVEDKKVAGDEVKNEVELSRLDALISGDETNKDALTSDKLMNDIWG